MKKRNLLPLKIMGLPELKFIKLGVMTFFFCSLTQTISFFIHSAHFSLVCTKTGDFLSRPIYKIDRFKKNTPESSYREIKIKFNSKASRSGLPKRNGINPRW